MIDMLQNAKDLIAKGKSLADPELIQMGMDLLEQYNPIEGAPYLVTADDMGDGHVPPPKVQEPYYICQNCEHTMPIDREGRKRCPKCMKHRLHIITPIEVVEVAKVDKRPTYEELLAALEDQQLQSSPRDDMDQFHMQVRTGGDSNVHYDDQGNPDGTIRRRESVDPKGIHNTWTDEGEDRDDEVNARLKAFTKVSPRIRKPVKMMDVECDNCHKVEKMHPAHAGGRGRHLCEKCIRRRSQR